jgi:putative transposase
MTDSLWQRIQVFDPDQEYTVVQRRLPHWVQAGTISFITWRTWDSIPLAILCRWQAERTDWLKRHEFDPGAAEWQTRLARLPTAAQREFKQYASDRWNDHLDACHGACVLRQPALCGIVADSLRRLDGDRYELTDFVVMPNHVHLLAAFPDEQDMLNQCESWKHFTATQINRILRRKGRFWQQDGFDHLVRSVEQFDHLRMYIAENPGHARLHAGEFVHHSKRV